LAEQSIPDDLRGQIQPAALIYSVICTDASDYVRWQCDLLEHTWKAVDQPGELVHLAACAPTRALPRHRYARVVRTRPVDRDPRTGTRYVPINRLFSLQQWLEEERPRGTVLLLDPDCVFRHAITDEVEPGKPRAQHWIDFTPASLQKDALPARLGLDERTAESVQQATWPLLIHTEDLARVLPAWIENVTILETEFGWERDMFAFTAACAREGVRFSLGPVGVYMGWAEEAAAGAPVIHYCQKIKDANADTLWFKQEYVPWEPVAGGERAVLDYAREFLGILDAFASTKRVEILDGHFSMVPGWRMESSGGKHQLRSDAAGAVIELNDTGAMVAGLCDGTRSGREIAEILANAYPEQAEQISRDVVACLDRLSADGAIVTTGGEHSSGTSDAIDVRVRFCALPPLELRCTTGDPLLSSLFAALEAGPARSRLLCLPRGDDRAKMLYVPGSQVTAIETSPPVDPARLISADKEVPAPVAQSAPVRIIRNYLPKPMAQRLLAHALGNRDAFKASSVTTNDEDYRRSRVLFLDGELREQLEARVRQTLFDAAASLNVQVPPGCTFDSQLTASGHGDFFKSHRDRGNDGEEACNRLLTYVYYLNREPRPFSGGELRMYDFVDGSWNPADSYRTLTPEHNMLIVFPSWANHEVLPVIVPSGAFDDSRFTINGWLLEPERRL